MGSGMGMRLGIEIKLIVPLHKGDLGGSGLENDRSFRVGAIDHVSLLFIIKELTKLILTTSSPDNCFNLGIHRLRLDRTMFCSAIDSASIA